MPVYKNTVIFGLTTDPLRRDIAASHAGGWTESVWSEFVIDFGNAGTIQRLRSRAALLPNQASIQGFRVQTYTISGNRLLPGQSTSGRLQLEGALGDCDLPQCSLELGIVGLTPPMSTRYVIRAIPDEYIAKGEFWAPNPGILNLINLFSAGWLQGQGTGWVGRDLTLAPVRIINVLAGNLTTDAAIPGFANNDFIRFSRAYDVDGTPVTGAWRATLNVNGTYTLQNFDADTIIDNSGTVRKDALRFTGYGNYTIGRALVRKIGRPSQTYRGRRSRIR